MGLLSKLKSLLGLGDDRPARRGNVDVTVEHEPGGAADAESERAVKEPASEPTTGDAEPADSEPAPIEPDEPEPDEAAAAAEIRDAETDDVETDDVETEAAEPTADSGGPEEIPADEPSETDADDESAEADVEQVGPATEPVEAIKGIGPSYAERLESAGVETVGDLAGADADALGDETGLSPKRISGWIEQAEARTQ